MFRNIRRVENEIKQEDEIINLLMTSRRAVIAVNGDDGYPYALPINYFFDKELNCIYFHSSKFCHKVDSLRKSDKVCFTVYGNEKIKDEHWAPYIQSVVIFGRCHPIVDSNTAIEKLKKFAMKYYPNEEMINKEISKSFKAVQMFEIKIEHMSCKEVQEK